MTIPLVDLKSQYQDIRDEVMPNLQRVLDKANFILGEEVELFEDKFAAYCGAEHGVGVASGTDALHLALRAFNVGPGDEVITAANTFIATAMAISYTGATPVFVDVSPHDYNIDVALIERAITPRTKAIIPVHLYGLPADMDSILSIARRHELVVIEDAAQAHGAKFRGVPVGSIGDAGCFSFYPGKNLGAYGDGGIVVTNNREVVERLRRLRHYGQAVKNQHSMVGYNSRLDTLQAAVLLAKLNHLEQWNGKRRAIARRYRKLLAESDVVLPSDTNERIHVYHLFVIQNANRDELMAHLQQRQIYCGIHYPTPVPESPPYRSARTVPDGVPISSSLARQILSLPIYPELTDEQVNLVADGISNFFESGITVKPHNEAHGIHTIRAVPN